MLAIAPEASKQLTPPVAREASSLKVIEITSKHNELEEISCGGEAEIGNGGGWTRNLSYQEEGKGLTHAEGTSHSEGCT